MSDLHAFFEADFEEHRFYFELKNIKTDEVISSLVWRDKFRDIPKLDMMFAAMANLLSCVENHVFERVDTDSLRTLIVFCDIAYKHGIELHFDSGESFLAE